MSDTAQRNTERLVLILMGAAVVTVLLLIIGPDFASAAAEPGVNVGENLEKFLRGWAKPLFGGIVGFIALKFLLKRDFGELALFLLAAVLVGGLIFEPSGTQNVFTGIYKAIIGA